MKSANPNIAARLMERVAQHPDRIAIVEYVGGQARRVTFGALATRVAALASGLRARGVEPGDRVLLFIPMSIDLYLALLGCLHLGATAVFVDAWADRHRLDAAVGAAHPKAFIGGPKAHLLRLFSDAVRRIPIRLVAGRRWLCLERYERSHRVSPAAPVAPDDPALITFTADSRGAPQATARSHAFLWAQHQALAAYLGLTEADINMPALPVCVLNNLALGVTSVLPDFDPRRLAEIDPATLYHQLTAEKVTTSSGPPAFYERLAGWCAHHHRWLPLRALFTGGAPVLPPLARLLQRTVMGMVHVVYGSTTAPIADIEVGEMLCAMATEKPGSRPEGICVGSPVPGIAVRLVRPYDGPIDLEAGGWQKWEAPLGEVGEVVIAGAPVLASYLAYPAADGQHKIRDGDRAWYRTGDAARLDEKGRLWLMGRVRGRVQRGDCVWWSVPAELRALDVADITHAAYLGVPHLHFGQRAVLCVEAPRGELSPAERQALLAALSPIPVDELHVLRHIPRDLRHASKTDTAALRCLLSARRSQAV
ncbi:MAG: AMP-binding protein [Armatimonadetes bacterium]|nr:AMP-binding protein [Armatimonadota bacterium]